MGQYYLIASIDKQEFYYPFDCNNPSKLLEWGYIGSNTSLALLHLLQTSWKDSRVVVLGDYSEEFPDEKTRYLAMLACSKTYVNYYEFVEKSFKNIKTRLKPYLNKISKLSKEQNFASEKLSIYNLYKNKVFVSHTAKLYVDLQKQVDTHFKWLKENSLLMINPVALLLASGNGLGGGDYHETQPDFEYTGMFRFHNVGIYNFNEINLKSYEEITPCFFETQTNAYKSRCSYDVLRKELEQNKKG